MPECILNPHEASDLSKRGGLVTNFGSTFLLAACGFAKGKGNIGRNQKSGGTENEECRTPSPPGAHVTANDIADKNSERDAQRIDRQPRAAPRRRGEIGDH